MNSTTICWKWQDSTLEEDLEQSVSALLNRFSAGKVFISLGWITRPFNDMFLQQKIKECAALLAAHGVGLCVETCLRSEAEWFYRLYETDPPAYLASFKEIALDSEGNGTVLINTTPVYHYWRKTETSGPQLVGGAWSFDSAGVEEQRFYDPVTLKNITCGVSLEDAGDSVRRLTVRGGKKCAGQTACVCLLSRQAIPDLASPMLPGFYREMVKELKNSGVSGVFSDEWGYGIIIDIKEPNPYDDKELFLEHLSVSDSFADTYAERHAGYALADDMLHMRYCPETDPMVRVTAINRYIDTLRHIAARNDSDMYDIAKQTLGKDTFYGVHPTWWGSVDKLNFEVFKNGFYWWEAKRDIAQTDEEVILPIRTALSHKWDSHIFYNMWYSMGTQDILTYYKETYRNIRHGGRTHYHAYKCPNEPVVLELAADGLLEGLEMMEKHVRVIDDVQKTALDCRVLVLFGMEAVTNWHLAGCTVPPWRPENKPMDAVLNTAHALFERTLCDLVPTSEIAGGSLRIENGHAVYGSQEYDAVVLWYPDSMDAKCYPFLSGLDSKKLIVCGSAEVYNNGGHVSEDDLAVLDGAAVTLPEIPSAERLADMLGAMGIQSGRIPSGCVMQDGAWIFAADGEKPVGNPLLVDTVIGSRHVNFSGEDFLYLDLTGESPCAKFPDGGRLLIDWQEYAGS